MKKIFASQVEVGMRLSCDIYNDKGVLLWVAGSEIKTEQQANKLVKDGFRSDLQEWVPANTGNKVSEPLDVIADTVQVKKIYVYETVLDALTEIQLPLNYIFDVFKADAFHKDKRNLTHQIDAVVDVIMDVSEKHPDESLATINMFVAQGKYIIIHAIAKSVMAGIICEMLDLPEEQKKSCVSAALTANSSIVKLMETLCKQRGSMSIDQTTEYEGHPFNSLTLLTRAGVRDEEWLDNVLMHHEYFDRSGFPKGMGPDEITVTARIVAVADIYVTMIMPKQIMQQAIDPPSAFKRLYKQYGKRLDASIIADIIKRFGIMPPGTFVKLKDGKIGIVVGGSEDKSKPIVTKVGDDITKFYTEFDLTGQYKIVGILHPPSKMPKRLFKLWRLYEDSKKQEEGGESTD